MRKAYLMPAVILLAGLALLVSCSKDEDKSTSPDPNPQPSEGDYEASATVSSNAQATLHTVSGAKMHVPLYAVPPTEAGAHGTMVFSIERDQTVAPNLTDGETMVSDIYRFGPDGFVFSEMLSVTLPVTGDVSGKEPMLYRVNQSTGESEPYGGIYDEETGTITAQTYHLSPWYVGGRSATSTAWGAFKVTNQSATHWLNICVIGYELTYPDVDVNFDGDAWCSFAPTGTIGWASSGNWYLPQGTYDLCISMGRAGTVSSPPGEPQHIYVHGKALSSPWTRSNPVTTEITYSSLSGDVADGPCDCTPQPSTSVGTGEVQVTLTWHSGHAIDLDLWVTEPNGEMCFYGNTPTSTGGTLDRDNLCYNYEDGRPENIFWSSAPAGTYRVQVNLYSNCAGQVTSMPFDVRIVVGSNVTTYHGTVTTTNTTVDVTTFTVSSDGDGAGNATSASSGWPGATAVFGPYLGTPVKELPALPDKTRD